MFTHTPARPHVLFLFADTGGGHRSVTEAVVEAMQLEFDERVAISQVDFLRQYYPWPYRRLPEAYRDLVRFPRFYRTVWYSTNGLRRSRWIMDSQQLNPFLRRQHQRLIREHTADLIVMTHFMAIPPVIWQPAAQRPRTCVIVTDLISTHAAWFRPGIDLYITPTAEAQRMAVRHGILAEQVQQIGLPVTERYGQPPADRAALRARLGWPSTRPVVLLIGGAEGMGALEENAQAIAAANLPLTLAVVAGRNAALQARLAGRRWPIPTHVYGFVHNLPELMHAADILVTKAGPSTICEGLCAGLPILLYDRIPGQEEGNVTYVVEAGAGVFAPKPEVVVATLRGWLSNPDQLERARLAARQHAQPDAARAVARRLGALMGLPSAAQLPSGDKRL